MSICWANTDNFDESDIVILGIPDESKSHSLRKGTSEAPNKIRQISLTRDRYIRNNVISTGIPYGGIRKKVFDYGNVERNKVSEVINKIVTNSKIPISIGGDHSITVEIIKSISKIHGSLSLVYFDAHPDFISSTTNYYGSVFYDVLPFIDTKSSIQIGIRTPEEEELYNLKKNNLSVITPFDMLRIGLIESEKKIMEKVGRNVYVSFDMDAIDPAFAPGVSTPVPIGLRNSEAVYLLKSLVQRGIIGMDLMEVCPDYDIKDRTSHLASRMIGEVISSS